MGVERQVRRDLPLEPQALAVGRQQQLDGGRVEADAVVQPLHAVLGIDALDRQHRHQDLGLGDGAGIAGEQRLE